MVLTPTDLAKYPFTPQAAEHVQNQEHNIADLETSGYEKIVNRAEERIEEAICNGLVSDQTRNSEIEILSFPVAIVMASATNESSLKKRYALAEANRASRFLKTENSERLMAVAQLFMWKIRPTKINVQRLGATSPGFAIDFTSYLRNASIFHESKWKLVNRIIQHGQVHVSREEVSRLLMEEIRSYVEKRLSSRIDFTITKTIADRVEKLKQLHLTLKGEKYEEEMPKEIVIDAFPPCITRLYNTAIAKQHLSHIERFTLTSFLLNSGMPVENVVECFRPTSDFSEKLTRYQVEHIGGGKGSRTKYTPPQCTTLRTHCICIGEDEICERIRHPLACYKKRLQAMKSEASST